MLVFVRYLRHTEKGGILMLDTRVNRRPFLRRRETAKQQAMQLEHEKELHRYALSPMERSSLALALALVHLWLSCWYPGCPIVKSRRN